MLRYRIKGRAVFYNLKLISKENLVKESRRSDRIRELR